MRRRLCGPRADGSGGEYYDINRSVSRFKCIEVNDAFHSDIMRISASDPLNVKYKYHRGTRRNSLVPQHLNNEKRNDRPDSRESTCLPPTINTNLKTTV
jgi:hypothetical protein